MIYRVGAPWCRSYFEMEMQAHMSAGLSCSGSWSWPFMRRAVGMRGALSAAAILQYISVVLERCTNAGIGLVCIAVASSQSLRALLCLHQEEATLDCAGSFAPFPHMPGRRVVWLVENSELLTLNTYGLCVFLELVGDTKCRCKFSWSTALVPPWRLRDCSVVTSVPAFLFLFFWKGREFG